MDYTILEWQPDCKKTKDSDHEANGWDDEKVHCLSAKGSQQTYLTK